MGMYPGDTNYPSEAEWIERDAQAAIRRQQYAARVAARIRAIKNEKNEEVQKGAGQIPGDGHLSGPQGITFPRKADSPVREAAPSAYLACPTCAGTGYVRAAALAD